ncbi:MAG: Maf family nucleotide pyrophosphatase [Saprospiraceae bacterium]|nr:Maf family nucleotide pyrophosphatase [Saprospiraceae bacterium]
MLKNHFKILLASKSPRRHQLVEQLGCTFEIIQQDAEEIVPEDLPRIEVAEYLAKLKATSVQHKLQQANEVILCSDTIVVLDDTIYHKPKDHQDAIRILSDLSGQVHQVITGVCLVHQDWKVSFSDIAKVHFDEITPEEMEYYIREYQPYDKAGAYAVQEWIGLAKIKKIEGTYATIMGLPTHLIYTELCKKINK